jgi:hypothetical protein
MKKEEDFGTNADGTRNKEYCHFCFKDGKFLDEGISMEEKIEKLIELGVAHLGMSEEQARTMARETIPKLKRWQGEGRDF